jgi:RHS repeat-associated protein
VDALDRVFAYDAIYRLVSATGREQATPPTAAPWDDFPKSQDPNLTRSYTETYRYDAMGNIEQMRHAAGDGSFTRDFTHETASNRLVKLTTGQGDFAYTFDANGNMRSETTTRHFEWNDSDQMKVFRNQVDGAEPSVHAHYLYDAAGQRVKKLVRQQGGGVEVTHYIDGAFEHHHWKGSGQVDQNNHVHMMDDMQRIALVRVGPAHSGDRGVGVQFHLGDHLSSSYAVIDLDGALINREEFTPLGETSFGSFSRKRYRFTGMERDEESGLSYHKDRYLSPWLARWLSADPSGIKDDINVYAYVSNNSIQFIDRSGDNKQKAWGKEDAVKEPSISTSKKGGLISEVLKDSEGNKIGHVYLFYGEAGGDNKGFIFKGGVLDIEAEGKFNSDFSFIASAEILNLQISVNATDGVQLEGSLLEAGVGLKAGPVQGKILFGAGAGFKFTKKGIKVKYVWGIGGEIEVDPDALAGYFGYEFDPSLLPDFLIPDEDPVYINIDIPMHEETTTRYSITAKEDAPPPPLTKPSKPKVKGQKPREIKYSECQFGPGSPDYRGRRGPVMLR